MLDSLSTDIANAWQGADLEQALVVKRTRLDKKAFVLKSFYEDGNCCVRERHLGNRKLPKSIQA